MSSSRANCVRSEGQARITVFGAQSNARTFDYQGGDIAYVPSPYGHYVENTGNTTLRFLEIFNSGTLGFLLTRVSEPSTAVY